MPRARKAKPKPAVHVFAWDSASDWRGVATCSVCGGLRTDSVHDLSGIPDTSDVDARRLGEGS